MATTRGWRLAAHEGVPDRLREELTRLSRHPAGPGGLQRAVVGRHSPDERDRRPTLPLWDAVFTPRRAALVGGDGDR